MNTVFILYLLALLAKIQAIVSRFNILEPFQTSLSGSSSRPVNNYALNCYYERELTEDCAKNFGYYCTSTGQLATTKLTTDAGCDTCTCIKIASTALSLSPLNHPEQPQRGGEYGRIGASHKLGQPWDDKCSSESMIVFADRYKPSKSVIPDFFLTNQIKTTRIDSFSKAYAPISALNSRKTQLAEIGNFSSDNMRPISGNKKDTQPVEEGDTRTLHEHCESDLYPKSSMDIDIDVEHLLHFATLSAFL